MTKIPRAGSGKLYYCYLRRDLLVGGKLTLNLDNLLRKATIETCVKHVSLFAAGSQMVAKKFAKELKGYIQSKGTIQFPLDAPLPADLIARIVKARLQENEERTK